MTSTATEKPRIVTFKLAPADHAELEMLARESERTVSVSASSSRPQPADAVGVNLRPEAFLFGHVINSGGVRRPKMAPPPQMLRAPAAGEDILAAVWDGARSHLVHPSIPRPLKPIPTMI